MHAIVMLVTIRFNRQTAISFLQSMLFVVPTLMSATCGGPFHTYDQ
jgi:hypothetical protein